MSAVCWANAKPLQEHKSKATNAIFRIFHTPNSIFMVQLHAKNGLAMWIQAVPNHNLRASFAFLAPTSTDYALNKENNGDCRSAKKKRPAE